MQIAMKFFITAMVLSFPLVSVTTLAQAPYEVGVTKEQVTVIAKGWSIKKDILNKEVFTEGRKEKVGTIEDIIVTPDRNLSYAVISTGGFLGIGKHDVLVPVNQLKIMDTGIILPGATKESIKDMSPFVYTK